MIIGRKKYYKDLNHYIKLLNETSRDTYLVLSSQIKYLKERLNKETATDTNCILNLEKLKEKFDYLEKYSKISKEYFENV